MEPDPCDLLIRAEWIATVDPDDRLLGDAAVAIRDGDVVDIGPAGELESRHDPRRRVELPGHLLVPGLVNAHTHLAMTMFRGLADDMDLDRFLARLLPAEANLLDEHSVQVGTAAASVESLLGGVTTALDMYYFPDVAMEAAGRVGLRVLTGPVVLDGPGPDGIAPEDRIDWADEWLAAHPAEGTWRPVLSPHSTYLVAPDRLAEVRRVADAHDALVHLHAAETTAEVADVQRRHGARPVELLDRVGLLGERTVLGHGVHLTDAEIVRIAAAGAAVAHCPVSNLKLAAGTARVVELLDAGIVVGIGTDGPASSNDLDVLGAARVAALLQKGACRDATVVGAHQALAMATIGGARALGLGDRLGSIEVGKSADLVAVDLRGVHTQPVHDPVSTLVHAAGRHDVAHVWVEGTAVVVDRVPARVDAVDVAAELAALGPRVQNSIGPTARERRS